MVRFACWRDGAYRGQGVLNDAALEPMPPAPQHESARRGGLHHRRRLTAEQKAELVAAYLEGVPTRVLKKRFGGDPARIVRQLVSEEERRLRNVRFPRSRGSRKR